MAFAVWTHDGFILWMRQENAQVEQCLDLFSGVYRAHILRLMRYLWVEAWVAAQQYSPRAGDDSV